MRRRRFLALPLAAAAPALAQPSAPANRRLAAVASFSVLADIVAQVGGDRVAVRAIVGTDADSHSFQPRPSDAEALRRAALVVGNGLGFESWLDRLASAAGYRGPVVMAAEGIAPRATEAEHT